MKLLLAILSSLLLASGAFAANRDARFAEANRLYEAKDYTQARDVYLELAKDNLSREVFYNLANAEFRLGRVGQACLWYRRALFLDPRMLESSQNLNMLQGKLGFLRFEQSGMDRVVGWLAGNQWVYLAVAGGWIFALGTAAIFVLRPRQSVGVLVIAVTACGLIVAVLASTASVLNYRQLDPGKLAIVVEQDVAAMNSPTPDAKPVMNLPAGSEVRIQRDAQNWLFVYIPGEKAGWLRKSSLEPLWPYEARP